MAAHPHKPSPSIPETTTPPQTAEQALIAELQEQLRIAREPVKTAPLVTKPTAVDLDTFKDGEWRRRSDGMMFKLKKVPAKSDECNFSRTHVLKNNELTVELHEEEFRQQFEKP